MSAESETSVRKCLRLRTTNGSMPVSAPLRGEATTIGSRPENDMVIQDPGVSRLHAVVELRGSTYWLVYRKSKNGTFLNNMEFSCNIDSSCCCSSLSGLPCKEQENN